MTDPTTPELSEATKDPDDPGMERVLRAGLEDFDLSDEDRALLEGAVVMECSSGGRPVELAMSRSTATGFLAWLEATPPGATLPR